MTIFLPKGSGQAYQKNIAKTLSSPIEKEARREVLELLREDSNVSKNLEEILMSENATAWGTKDKYNEEIDLMKEGDHMLMVVSGTIQYIQRIDFVLDGVRPDVSEILWGRSDFPYVWFSKSAVEDVEFPVSELESRLEEEAADFDGLFGGRSYFDYIEGGTLDAIGGEKKLIEGMRQGSDLSDIENIRLPDAEIEPNSDILNEVELILNDSKQVLFYGPPGTGKTYYARKYAEEKYGNEQTDTQRWKFVTFHPSYSYEEFVEGIRPKQTKNGLNYKPRPGVFKDICDDARETDEDYLLIIDEINRGNISSIFGELITLLEEDKRGMEVSLPYSDDSFDVPSNLHIIGTMNTADRSIASIDIALRRRFTHMEFAPDINEFIRTEGFQNRTTLEEVANNGSLSALSAIAIETINQKLMDEGLESGKKIGYSYFMNTDGDDEIVRIWKYEILPLLNEYFFDDYVKIRSVLEDHNRLLVDEEQKSYKNFGTSELQTVLERIIS